MEKLEFKKIINELEFDIAPFPKEINDLRAIKIAYNKDLDRIVNYLKSGLSVLVECDRMLTEFIYQYACYQANKKPVLDPEPEEYKEKIGKIIGEVQENEILVLRSIDVLNQYNVIRYLYSISSQGKRAQLLAFKDPALELNTVVANRFQIRIVILGIPRYFDDKLDGKNKFTTSYLITEEEKQVFEKYDPEALYKHVSGLNALSLRSAIKYISATLDSSSSSDKIFKELRLFKSSSSEEVEIPKVNFDDIGGYEETKDYLRKIIKYFDRSIDEDEKEEKTLIPKGFIFHGPPGTGKTLFAKAIANELNATIQMISGPEILSKWWGESEANVRQLFANARRNAPSIILFDEFDSIATKRNSGSSGGDRAGNALMAQILTELDGFRKDENILIIGTTNRINLIDEALLRPSRLYPIEIGMPDFIARKKVSSIHIKNFGIEELLTKQLALALEYFDEWRALKEENNTHIPQSFLDIMFDEFKSLKTHFLLEQRKQQYATDLTSLFEFVDEVRGSMEEKKKKRGLFSKGLMKELAKRINKEDKIEKAIKEFEDESKKAEKNIELIKKIRNRLIKIAGNYELNLMEKEDLEEENKHLKPIHTDIQALFSIIEKEFGKNTLPDSESYIDSILNLIAEYTDGFNNDEIQSIFKEASFEFKMEGKMISPRYLGQKIGIIQKRRDENKAMHI